MAVPFDNVNLRIPVKLAQGNKRLAGIIVSLSDTCLCLATSFPIHVGARLSVACHLAAEHLLKAEVEVADCQLPKGARVADCRVTARFIEMEPASRQVLNEFLSQKQERRQCERVETQLKATIVYPGAYSGAFTGNGSPEGMFLHCAMNIRPETFIRLQVYLRDDLLMLVDGRVVYVLGEEEARQRGREPGVGIQILNLDPADREKWEQYLEMRPRQRTKTRF